MTDLRAFTVDISYHPTHVTTKRVMARNGDHAMQLALNAAGVDIERVDDLRAAPSERPLKLCPDCRGVGLLDGAVCPHCEGTKYRHVPSTTTEEH